MILGLIRNVGQANLSFMTAVGKISLFTFAAVRWSVAPPFYGRQLRKADSGYWILFPPGCGSDNTFSGMVLALQSYTGFARFSAEDTVATVVVLSVTRELGPVLAGLMVAGRIGASMAAEIGTMRVTDQIDALDTLSTRPMQYLVAPRVGRRNLVPAFIGAYRRYYRCSGRLSGWRVSA